MFPDQMRDSIEKDLTALGYDIRIDHEFDFLLYFGIREVFHEPVACIKLLESPRKEVLDSYIGLARMRNLPYVVFVISGITPITNYKPSDRVYITGFMNNMFNQPVRYPKDFKSDSDILMDLVIAFPGAMPSELKSMARHKGLTWYQAQKAYEVLFITHRIKEVLEYRRRRDGTHEIEGRKNIHVYPADSSKEATLEELLDTAAKAEELRKFIKGGEDENANI